jgi:WD40 repeat protein
MSAVLPRDLAERIDRACDRFESAWRTGRPGRLEDEVNAVDEPERPAFLRELLATEVELRRAQGDDPAPSEYVHRFPGHDTAVDAAFRQACATGRPAPRRLPAVPGYEILGELGRGGMGVVYRARRLRLNRHCALKMILGGAHASPETLRRFLAEAETIARLEHPNIVRIHHIGEADGLPFFELEYVPGGSLDQVLDGTPRSAREAVGLVEGLARGMAEAHRLGVVHRDLKPANILLAADGTPKITDFGLAKALDSEGGLTRTESILGSPSYMAPEQAEGRAKQVGPAADTYALGAILYELLTGRPPFQAATALETMQQVREAEPVRPSRLRPGLARDVETICLTCLHKDPTKRYATAGALSEDLRRFQAGEPIRARPPAWHEHVWRWCVRNPALAGALASVMLLAVTLVAGLTSAAVRLGRAAERLRTERNLARSHATRAERAERDAEEKLWESYLEQARARRSSTHMGRRFEGLEAVRKATALNVFPDRRGELRDVAIALMTQVDVRPLRSWDVGYPSWTKGTIAIDPGFERYARYERDQSLHVRRVANDADLISVPVSAAEEYNPWFSHDGRSLAINYFNRASPPNHLLWDLERRSAVDGLPPAAFFGGFAKDGSLAVLFEAEGWVSVHALPRGERVAHWHAGTRLSLCVPSFDGAAVATVPEGGSEISIHDLTTGKVRRRFGKDVALERLGNSVPVTNLAWKPNGRQLAAATGDRIFLWHPPTGAYLTVLEGHQNRGNAVEYDRAGDLMASWGWDGTTRIWDPVGGRELVSFHGLFRGWGPGDRSLLAWEGREATVYEVALGRECRTLGHGRVGNRVPTENGGLWSIGFSPDSRWFAAAGGAGVYVYRASDGMAVTHLLKDFCESVAFQPDGRILTYNFSRGLARWLVRFGPEDALAFDPPEILRAPGDIHGSINYLAQDRAGRLILLADWKWDRALLLDLNSPGVPPRFLSHKEIRSVALSPDGRWAATGTWTGKDVKVWDTATGTLVKNWPAGGASVTFSPDGRWFATHHDGAYWLYRVGTWEPGLVLSSRGPAEGCPLAFPPSGQVIAIVTTVESENAVALVDLKNGWELGVLQAPGGRFIHWLAFSPDGRRLAATTSSDRIQLWDLTLLGKGLAALGLDQGFPNVHTTVTTED